MCCSIVTFKTACCLCNCISRNTHSAIKNYPPPISFTRFIPLLSIPPTWRRGFVLSSMTSLHVAYYKDVKIGSSSSHVIFLATRSTCHASGERRLESTEPVEQCSGGRLDLVFSAHAQQVRAIWVGGNAGHFGHVRLLTDGDGE